MTGISVVVTVLDDRDGLAELLPALHRQTRPLDELVVVDGGSTDGSAELAEQWRGRGLPVRWIAAPGAGISAGRNLGIREAAHERIAVTDAGCRPEPGWLAALDDALEQADLAAGTYVVDPATPFEHAAAVALYPSLDELEPGPLVQAWHRVFGRRFGVREATGRSMAFTRDAWRAAGGFPEDVNAGEDVAFASAIVDAGRPARLAPAAAVVWRGRRTWRANARMYFTYAHGDAVLGRAGRTAVRGAALVAGLGLVAAGGRPGRAAAAAGAAAYLSLPLARARRTGLAARHLWRVPLLLALKDGAMLAGAVAGTWRRRALSGPGDGRAAGA
jgi:GT2 family glycosyltransferase